jgi:two-component system, NtrC family, sensor histidine kinase GlrK
MAAIILAYSLRRASTLTAWVNNLYAIAFTRVAVASISRDCRRRLVWACWPWSLGPPPEERHVRLTIFWRVILAQISLMALVVAVNFYALSQLNQLTTLSAEIRATDWASIEEEKRLLRIFLAQMRNAEKYVLLRDTAFYNHFSAGNEGFDSTLERLMALIDTPRERELLGEIRDLHLQYAASLTTGLTLKSAWNKEKIEISEGITTRINDLIRFREDAIARKTKAARDHAAVAADVVGWLTLGGISLAVFLAYFHARGVSRPLKKLAQELRLVGTGEFQRCLNVHTPAEVGELARAFNWMASRLAELDEMKEDFIAHVSHELRTPLTAIQEGTTLLWEELPGPLTTSQREVVEVVRNHSERLFRFLASVLDFSKMEAGMMEYVYVPSDLYVLLDRSVQTVQLTARRKRIQVEISCPVALPLLSLDGGRMQQVLDNLLSNAVKFTPSGGMIRVMALLKDTKVARQRWVEVRVSDTGAGIPAEEVERIFDKFYQSQHHRRERERGTGLGLAIARHIVEAHSGRIWVESQLGKGSTFVVALPVQEQSQEEQRIGNMKMLADPPPSLHFRAKGGRHAL